MEIERKKPKQRNKQKPKERKVVSNEEKSKDGVEESLEEELQHAAEDIKEVVTEPAGEVKEGLIEEVVEVKEEVIAPSDETASAPEIVSDTKFKPEKLLYLNNALQNEANYTALQNQLTELRMEKAIETIAARERTSVKVEEVAIKAYTVSQLTALYTNSELETIDKLTLDFVEAQLKSHQINQHPLYKLLISYLQDRGKLKTCEMQVTKLRATYAENHGDMWTVDKSVAMEKKPCSDGHVVAATHTFDKAHFHQSVFVKINNTLSSIRELLVEDHVLYCYSVKDLKLKIEMYLQNITSNLITVTRLHHNAPIYMGIENPPPHVAPLLAELRVCISVLFYFQRRLCKDAEFVRETRDWLAQLVHLLLRLATWQDHLFLVNHVLRCPSGVGTWAASFVQVPLDVGRHCDTPFADYGINHAVATLALILAPVTKREKFLEEIYQQKNTSTEAMWVIVDSDGEDDESAGTALRENDLVALLNQLPMNALFKTVLRIHEENGKSVFNEILLDENHTLRFFSFSTTLLTLFHKGLQTYSQTRYMQFCKRLSRFIRHVVQYATDQFEIFCKRNRDSASASMVARLQVEYDAFFLRAIFYLYSAEKMGAWQFLAVIPYGVISKRTLWKVFYFLHQLDKLAKNILDPENDTDYANEIWEPMTRAQFQEKLCSLAEDECYYLLNTFANMALARTADDMIFIETATMDLLQVGFISETTQETCSKNARILLTHITSKHPHLLSFVLKSVKENMSHIGPLSLYLYEELPIFGWRVRSDDLEIISNLLLQHPITSNESKLARMILSRLNWELEKDELFLPYAFHCKIASLISRAVEQNQGYLHWAWQTAFRLRLHISDKGFKGFDNVKDIEYFDVISKGVQSHQPFSAFLSVLISNWGHLVPLICTKGFDQLLLLQTHQKHEAVLFALDLIIPLFIECQEAAINLEKFQNVLQGLLNADRTYTNIAMSYLTTQQTVLEQFGNMIESQIANYAWYNLETPKLLVRLWVNSLVSMANWNRDYGVMYLLDVIIKASFFHTDTMLEITTILKELLQCSTPQEQSNAIGSLFKWVSQSNSAQTNLLINTSLSSWPYLAYVMIGIGFEEREKSTGLWPEILQQLNQQKGKVNVDSAIKQAASKLKVPTFYSGSLCFFRWAQQILDTPIDHPILVLFWQKFYLLYLYWIPVAGGTVRMCIGNKFFQGMINLGFLKRLKKHLQESVDYYKRRTTEEEFNHAPPAHQLFYMSSLKVFTAYSIWLEEPKLQNPSLYLPSLPPQYEPQLLNSIIQNDEKPWFEYVDYSAIKNQQSIAIRSWRSANYRERKNINRVLSNAGAGMESEDPVERIFRRLTSYDTPVGVPPIKTIESLLPALRFGNLDELVALVRDYFKIHLQLAHNHEISVGEFMTLDKVYHQLVPQLYRAATHKLVKKVRCVGTKDASCLGPAVITLQFEETTINEQVHHKISENRDDYATFVSQFMLPPPNTLCLASAALDQIINILLKMKADSSEYNKLGVELFYYILSVMNEEISNYPPARKCFDECLDRLGNNHIKGIEFETARLLKEILENPTLAKYLCPHFSPAEAGIANFLQMYSMITKAVGNTHYDSLYMLLSKFNVNDWLNQHNPKLSQRSQLIELIMAALIRLGHEPVPKSQPLHEIMRRHLINVFEYQFPEHYGEILVHVLKASNGDADSIAITVWLDILNSLSKPIHLELNMSVRDNLRQCAQKQQLLKHQELVETAMLLANHFATERFQYGLYGLYPKARNYTDVFVLFLGLIGHNLIISTFNSHQGALGDKICETLWPQLRDMFAPWVVPYWTNSNKENMAYWIQQLTDDRSVVLPWIPANGPFAQKMVNIFFECVLFIVQTLPACNILNFVWQWYVTNFAHQAVKDHVLNVVHQSFFNLPWHKFCPTMPDLEFMLKVMDQYLPECHTFLAHIFMEVPWKQWISGVPETTPLQIRTRMHHCLLNLLVKVGNEPNVKNNQPEKLKNLLVQMETLDWYILEVASVQQAIDWYVMSCDSLVLLKTEQNDLDFRVNVFLQHVCFYLRPLLHPEPSIQEKRFIYVRGYVKLVAVFLAKHKAAKAQKELYLVDVLKNQLTHMDSVIYLQEEFNVILSTFLTVLNNDDIKRKMLLHFEKWLREKEGDGLAVKAMLAVLGVSIIDCDVAAVLFELSIHTYFHNNVMKADNPTWNQVALLLSPPTQSALIDVLIVKGSVFTLHALLVQKRTGQLPDLRDSLSHLMHWIASIKVEESAESKMPLLWTDFLEMSLLFCDKDPAAARTFLHKFAKLLLDTVEYKEGGAWNGILGVIGVKKQNTLTLPYKFLCRALGGYVLAQLPDQGDLPVRKTANAPYTMGQRGCNSEATKVLLKLDFGQSQGAVREWTKQALKQIQDSNNSMHNVMTFLSQLVHQVYTKPYLKDIS